MFFRPKFFYFGPEKIDLEDFSKLILKTSSDWAHLIIKNFLESETKSSESLIFEISKDIKLAHLTIAAHEAGKLFCVVQNVCHDRNVLDKLFSEIVDDFSLFNSVSEDQVIFARSKFKQYYLALIKEWGKKIDPEVFRAHLTESISLLIEDVAWIYAPESSSELDDANIALDKMVISTAAAVFYYGGAEVFSNTMKLSFK